MKITVIPAPVYVERSELGQHLNFDFLLENDSERALRVHAIQVSAIDRKGQLLLRKSIDSNAVRPSIHTIGNTELGQNEQLYVFNPFHTFNANLDFQKLCYEFQFVSDDGERIKSNVTVTPTFYETQTDLIFPLKGRIIVDDGHDFYGHHRRIDLTHWVAELLGIKANSGRYAYDFCIVDEAGDLYRGSGESEQDWLGFGAPVYAPGAGTVATVVNDMPDYVMGKTWFDWEKDAEKLENSAGNYVQIDHLNGEYSVVCHLKRGSVTVKAGEQVEQGALIGYMGFSGSNAFPHVHYELRNGVDWQTAEGLPCYFGRFRRLLGAETIEVQRGQVDSGEILESMV